jgi:hypothetical protein
MHEIEDAEPPSSSYPVISMRRPSRDCACEIHRKLVGVRLHHFDQEQVMIIVELQWFKKCVLTLYLSC